MFNVTRHFYPSNARHSEHYNSIIVADVLAVHSQYSTSFQIADFAFICLIKRKQDNWFMWLTGTVLMNNFSDILLIRYTNVTLCLILSLKGYNSIPLLSMMQAHVYNLFIFLSLKFEFECKKIKLWLWSGEDMTRSKEMQYFND